MRAAIAPQILCQYITMYFLLIPASGLPTDYNMERMSPHILLGNEPSAGLYPKYHRMYLKLTASSIAVCRDKNPVT